MCFIYLLIFAVFCYSFVFNWFSVQHFAPVLGILKCFWIGLIATWTDDGWPTAPKRLMSWQWGEIIQYRYRTNTGKYYFYSYSTWLSCAAISWTLDSGPGSHSGLFCPGWIDWQSHEQSHWLCACYHRRLQASCQTKSTVVKNRIIEKKVAFLHFRKEEFLYKCNCLIWCIKMVLGPWSVTITQFFGSVLVCMCENTVTLFENLFFTFTLNCAPRLYLISPKTDPALRVTNTVFPSGPPTTCTSPAFMIYISRPTSPLDKWNTRASWLDRDQAKNIKLKIFDIIHTPEHGEISTCTFLQT